MTDGIPARHHTKETDRLKTLLQTDSSGPTQTDRQTD